MTIIIEKVILIQNIRPRPKRLAEILPCTPSLEHESNLNTTQQLDCCTTPHFSTNHRSRHKPHPQQGQLGHQSSANISSPTPIFLHSYNKNTKKNNSWKPDCVPPDILIFVQ